MDLIIHPGHSKCGSSAIQQFLFDHRAALAARGYAIPDSRFRFGFERSSAFSFELAPIGYLSRTVRRRAFGTLEKRIGQAMKRARRTNIHTVILSAENLSNPFSEPLHEIFLRHFDVKSVVYYIRRQDDFLMSAWQQWGHKSGKPLGTFCEEWIRGGLPDYDSAIDMLGTFYGDSTLAVVPFSRHAFSGGELINDFLERTGLAPFIQPEKRPFVVNKSLNPLVCEYLSHCTSVYRTGHDNRPKIDLQRHSEDEPWLFESRRDYMSAGQRKAIMDHFEATNRALHARYFSNLPYETLFGVAPDGEGGQQDGGTVALTPGQRAFLDQWTSRWLATRHVRLLIIIGRRALREAERWAGFLRVRGGGGRD